MITFVYIFINNQRETPSGPLEPIWYLFGSDLVPGDTPTTQTQSPLQSVRHYITHNPLCKSPCSTPQGPIRSELTDEKQTNEKLNTDRQVLQSSAAGVFQNKST